MAREPETYCEDSIFETGIGQVVVCRYKSGGRVEVGSFLVDVYCLGVKDAFFRVYDEVEFSEDCLARVFSDGIPVPKPASWGRKLVEDAARYASSLGFSPHPDYKKGARVFGGVDAADCGEEFVFGNEGKPLYVRGPYDGEDKAQLILSTLRAKLGDDGFHYIIPTGEDGEEYGGDEDGDGAIFAMDSEADDGSPDPALVAFAENFQDQNEGFDDIEYGGKTGAMLAADLLEQARQLKREMEGDGEQDLTLEKAVRILQTLWNLRALPEEDRAEALRIMPREMADYFREAVEECIEDLNGNERLIFDFRLLHADVQGKERLLLLLESF